MLRNRNFRSRSASALTRSASCAASNWAWAVPARAAFASDCKSHLLAPGPGGVGNRRDRHQQHHDDQQGNAAQHAGADLVVPRRACAGAKELVLDGLHAMLVAGRPLSWPLPAARRSAGVRRSAGWPAIRRPPGPARSARGGWRPRHRPSRAAPTTAGSGFVGDVDYRLRTELLGDRRRQERSAGEPEPLDHRRHFVGRRPVASHNSTSRRGRRVRRAGSETVSARGRSSRPTVLAPASA